MITLKTRNALYCIATVMCLSLPLSSFADDSPVVSKIDDDLALGQDVDRQRTFRPVDGSGSSDLFGSGGGFIHPYISVTGLYSDNIYNTPTNEESDSATIISPGLLLAYPGVKNMSGASFSTSNLSPGGLLGDRTSGDSFRRLQTSLLYQADIEDYADNSSADTDQHRLEALFQLNLKGGVHFGLAGEYKLAADAFSGSTLRDEYQSDLIDLVIGIEIGSKINLDLGYTGFQLDYDAIYNNDRDRQDTTYTGRLSYDILSKTSVFAEYQRIDVDYDLLVPDKDSEVQNGNVGIKWDVTAKSSGQFKVGQSSRDHESASLVTADTDELFYQLQIGHTFTPKTSLGLTGTRRLSETTVVGTNFILNHQVSMNYKQRLSAKIVANLDASYSRDEFDGLITLGSVTKEREDSTVLITPAIDYLMKDWFIVSLSYSLAERDSNFDTYDFTTNSFFLRITGYL